MTTSFLASQGLLVDAALGVVADGAGFLGAEGPGIQEGEVLAVALVAEPTKAALAFYLDGSRKLHLSNPGYCHPAPPWLVVITLAFGEPEGPLVDYARLLILLPKDCCQGFAVGHRSPPDFRGLYFQGSETDDI